MQLSSVLFAAAALLAPVYSSTIVPIGRRETGLNVELASVANTKVKVSVTNSADHEINVLKVNSFFDDSPVQKVNVHNKDCDKGLFPEINCQKLPFMGINRAYDLSQLSKEDFQPIAAGHTVDAEFDISETFDLTPGEYAISSEGSLPFSNPDCTGISGVIPYKSNEITVKVTEPSIAGVSKGTVNRRGAVDDTTCTKDQKAAVDTAVKRASSLSKAAADAAVNGDARLFEYYFRTTDSATRQEVAARFAAIANETSSVDGGKATYNCGNDVKQSDCGKGVLAYAVSGKNMVVTCPDWYKILPETDDCGGKDKGLTMLHEISHLGAVYNPPTTDMAYGYDSIISLSKEDAIRNADTYNYYAAAIDLGCQPGDGKGPELPDWMVNEILNGQKQ